MRREGNVLPPRHCRGKKTWYEREKEGRKRYGRTAVAMKERVGGEWMLAMNEGISEPNRGTDREVRCEEGSWLDRETTSFSFSFPFSFSFLSTNGCWSCDVRELASTPALSLSFSFFKKSFPCALAPALLWTSFPLFFLAAFLFFLFLAHSSPIFRFFFFFHVLSTMF